MKSIILCLLPGLEDETSEDFDRVLQTLNRFSRSQTEESSDGRHAASSGSPNSFFWQCFFLATVTSPSRRQGALAYLTRHLPKFGTQRASTHEEALKSISTEAQAALSPEPGLLIRCFSAGLSDKQVLVQRGFLDLLVTHLPLDSAVLQHSVPSADLDRLVSAAVGVVGRRDMSLNRRLWSWFLGPEPKGDALKGGSSEEKVISPGVDSAQHHAAYFSRHGLRALTRSVLALLNQNSRSAWERAKPFRICLSLMDRWEVGGLLIPHVFIPALKNAYDFDQQASKRDSNEVLKSASNFFDGVESGLIWAKIAELASNALKGGATSHKERLFSIRLCIFILQRFNLREEEMVLHHMPLTSLFILMLLNKGTKVKIAPEIRLVALEILEKLVAQIPSRAFKMEKTSRRGGPSKDHENETSVFAAIESFYQDDQGNIEDDVSPVAPQLIARCLLRQAHELFISVTSEPSRDSPAIDLCMRIYAALLRSVPDASQSLADVGLLSGLRAALSIDSNTAPDFSALHAVATVLATVQGLPGREALISNRDLFSFQDLLVKFFWQHLGPSTPKFHVEAVRSLWQLEAAGGTPRMVEASITSLLSDTSGNDSTRFDACRRFAVLWAHSIQERAIAGEKGSRTLPRRTGSYVAGSAHNFPADPAVILSRPLLIVLDSLEHIGSEEAAFVAGWLQQLPSLPNVLELLVAQIRELKSVKESAGHHSGRRAARPQEHADRDECLFLLRHILRIIQAASEHTWIVLAGDTTMPLDSFGSKEGQEIVLHGFFIQICMRLLAVADYTSTRATTDLERVALEMIQLIVDGPFSAPLKELELEVELLKMLNSKLDTLPSQLQTSFLNTITACLRLRTKNTPTAPMSPTERKLSRDRRSSSQGNLLKDGNGREPPLVTQPPPNGLVEAIKIGFASANCRLVIDDWVVFLRNVLPLLSDTLFQHLIPLVEIFCSQISTCFEGLRSTFLKSGAPFASPEPAVVGLLNGLEQILATAHDKLISDESRNSAAKGPEQPQGFFGNVSTMTSGLFNADTEKQPSRSATANSRLAVLLCFQDTLRCCFKIWTWGVHGHQNIEQDASSAASFAYTSLRLRKRALRVLENLFAAEALECLELLATLFAHPISDEYQAGYVLELLNILNGSRPKYTAPAIFNAIYRRINTEPSRDSVQTSDLSAADLVTFLMEYVKSIEDDAMDEIWADCMAFLRDILNNPLDYSQILPLLLSFVALIAEKADNTNFGEQRKMRKELGVCIDFVPMSKDQADHD